LVTILDDIPGDCANHNITDPSDSSPNPDEESQYYNKVAFLAQLTSSRANFVPNPEEHLGPFDFSLYALRDFRQAFESTAEPHAPTTTLLRSTALWMVYAADRLWANVEANRDHRHKSSNSNPGGAGDAYAKTKKHWVGFNRERWDIWVQGLRNGVEIGDEETKGLVKRALEEVGRVEDQGWRVKDAEKFT